MREFDAGAVIFCLMLILITVVAIAVMYVTTENNRHELEMAKIGKCAVSRKWGN